MIASGHYDEEGLLALLDVDGEDEHIRLCATCSESLHSFREIAGALGDADVWSETVWSEPSRESINGLRAAARAMQSGKRTARPRVSELLGQPSNRWLTMLDSEPGLANAGTVRLLLDAVTAAIDERPARASEISRFAVEAAARVEGDSDSVRRLRGAAWREHAYTLFYTGRFADAAVAVERADQEFAACAVDEYDRARTGIVRALVDRAMERDAIDVARTSAEVFGRFGDVSRYASARIAEVQQLFTRRDYAAAIEVLERLQPMLAGTSDLDTEMRLYVNLGYAYRLSGDVDRAMDAYQIAAGIVRAIGNAPEALRIEWNLASALAETGRIADARGRLETLAGSFASLGMISESALVKLDLSEILLASEEYDAVERLCREAIESIRTSGIPYAARAMTALAYMQEATRQRRVTPLLVKHVRDYLRRLPEHEQLLFAPPV